MAELVDAADSKSASERSGGSIPSMGTKHLTCSDETVIILNTMIVHLKDYGTLAQLVEQ